MIVELGHFALILAFVVALVQMFSVVARDSATALPIVRVMARVQCALIMAAFIALVFAFVRSDFSVLLVAINSHVAKPLVYKIAGVWGNHEGSMLLWVLILSAYGAALSLQKNLNGTFALRVLAVQAALSSAFLAFSLFTSNPFTRLSPAPFEGQGLNPVLQDLALAAHPPLLYLGYVGASVGFAFAIAAMLKGRADAEWARLLRPWVLWAWAFLTLGIALGSYWAYYELGWGGFWFWDPVENASLMPWLAGTALLHSVRVTARNGALARWTLLLAIATFALSLIGLFLVRSGVLTSVHAFANDPSRGVFILAILVGFIGGALALYGRLLAEGTVAKTQITPMSREGALVLNNVFLATATATVFLGTLYPLVVDAFGGGKISVGAPYYNAVLLPLIIPLVAFIPFGPLTIWGGRKGSAMDIMRRLTAPMLGAILVALLVYIFKAGASLGAALAMGGAAWLIFGALADSAKRARRLSNYAAACAHAGIGVMVVGIVGSTAWKSETIIARVAGETVQVAGIEMLYEGVVRAYGPNYTAERATLRILNGRNIGTRLLPERRFYESERSRTTEAAIDKRLGGNLYAVIGDAVMRDGSPARVIRVWYHPLVSFIWLGAILMAIGGGLSWIGGRRKL